MSEVKIEYLPSKPGSQTLFKTAESKKELDAIIADAKNDVFAYRISIDGREAYASQGSGVYKRWYKSHAYFRKVTS